MRTRFVSLLAVLAVGTLLLPPAARAEDPLTTRPGWRTDGTGRYPQADIPADWSSEQNVLWFAPTEEPSNATPIVVGGKLFVAAEPHTLLCLDAADGNLLWQKSVPIESALTDPQQAEFQAQAEKREKLRAQLDELNKELTLLDRELRFNKTKLSQTPSDPKIEGERKALAKKRGELAAELHNLKRKLGRRNRKKNPPTKEDVARRKELEKLIRDMNQETDRLAAEEKNAPQAEPFKKRIAELKPQIAELQKRKDTLSKRLGALDAYQPPKTHKVNGYTSPTPTSDGERVYVTFTTGVAAAFDLDGERLWARYVEQPQSPSNWGQCASPLLAGGKLLVFFNNAHGLDPATGETAWTTAKRIAWGSPVRTAVGGVELAVCPAGEVIRAKDGALLANANVKLTYNAPIVQDGVAYFIEHNSKAFALPDANAVTGEAPEKPASPEPAWQRQLVKDRYYASPLIHDGLIYAITRKGVLSVVDAAKGEEVYQTKTPLGNTVYPSVSLIGEHVLLASDNGKMMLIQPGREYKVLAENRLSRFRSCPVVYNGKLYIRGLDGVYCIGKKP